MGGEGGLAGGANAAADDGGIEVCRSAAWGHEMSRPLNCNIVVGHRIHRFSCFITHTYMRSRPLLIPSYAPFGFLCYFCHTSITTLK